MYTSLCFIGGSNACKKDVHSIRVSHPGTLRGVHSNALIEHVQKSLTHAERFESKLTYPILNIAGMTGLNVRHFLNNLCSLPGVSYLEIGCYRGSTFVSSNFGNQDALCSSIAIDNWSEFENVRKCVASASMSGGDS